MAAKWKVEQGDALERMKALADNSVDLIVTDPPYPDLEPHRETGTTTRLSRSKGSNMDWFEVVDYKYLRKWFREAVRVLKPGRHLYVMVNRDSMWKMKPIGAKTEGLQFLSMLVWDKIAIGMGYNWRCTYEGILFFCKKGAKKRRLKDLGLPDVLHVKRLKGKPPKVYPTQKPVEVVKTLIKNSSDKREVVLDPFLGPGASVGIAAVQSKRKFIGFELGKQSTKIATRRIKGAARG